MRGKLFLRLRFTLLERNIPAYAGKTAFCCTTESKLSEHPRVCGENSPTLRPRCGWIGTSPRMRGKRMWRLDSLLGPRNIPAYAGKTAACRLVPIAPAEHPRVCGENNDPGLPPVNQIGTSPRMRGKRALIGDVLRMARNIPAYAGKTSGR